MTHKIEHKYFDHQQIKEGQNGPDEFYINTRLKVKKRRNCIRYFSEVLEVHKPELYKILLLIYFHPKITLLINLLDETATYHRQYYVLLHQILMRNVKKIYPEKDNHSAIMTEFLQELMAAKQLQDMRKAQQIADNSNNDGTATNIPT